MNERINAWLDGEIPFTALTPSEQRRARELASVLERAAERLDRPTADLVERVMTALPPGAPRERWTRRVARSAASFIPRGPSLRPAVGLGVLALALGFGLGILADREPVATPDATAAAGSETGAEPDVYVRFELRAPDAGSVHLAGSFTGWEPRYELTPAGESRWTVTVPLTPGVHDYVFIVDGQEYRLDPEAPKVADGFGGFNNRIALLASST